MPLTVTRAALTALACLHLACAPRYLEPPRAPRRIVPEVAEETAPREGEGQVILDVVGRTARADLVTERQVPPGPAAMWSMPRAGHQVNVAALQMPRLTTRALCVTPCRVNLPLGTHEVLFSDLLPGSPRSSTALVRVGERPSVLRHVLGSQEAYPGRVIGGVLLLGIGFGGVLTGSLLAAFGEVETSSGTGAVDLAPAGFITLGVGAVVTAVGAVLLGYSGSTIRPGATTHWTP